MRHGIVGITLFVLALVLGGTRAEAEEARGEETRIELRVGEQRLVTMGPMKRIALGNTESADVRTVGTTQLELSGHSPGTTTLLVWDTSGTQRAYSVVVTKAK